MLVRVCRQRFGKAPIVERMPCSLLLDSASQRPDSSRRWLLCGPRRAARPRLRTTAASTSPKAPGHPGSRHPRPAHQLNLGTLAHSRDCRSSTPGRLRSLCGPLLLSLRSSCGLQTNEQPRTQANTVPRGPAFSRPFAYIRCCSRLSKAIGAPGFEPGTSPTRTARATRLRHAPTQTAVSHTERFASDQTVSTPPTEPERLPSPHALPAARRHRRPGQTPPARALQGLLPQRPPVPWQKRDQQARHRRHRQRGAVRAGHRLPSRPPHSPPRPLLELKPPAHRSPHEASPEAALRLGH
jgi:hypothetical protein